MKRIVTYYFLIQALICSMIMMHIYHTFAEGFDDLLLIVSAFTFTISLWNLFGGNCSFLLYTIFLLFSVFVGLFLFVLFMLGGVGWLSLILCMFHSALNMYLVFYVFEH